MPRRDKLEEMLREDPHDPFLMYAVAMACVAEGDSAEGLSRLQAVIQQHPDYVAAYFQAAQVQAAAGDVEPARNYLQQGIVVAEQVGDTHAAAEMTGFLESL